LEAARIAAGRGHEVHLYEKEDRLGGGFAAASFPPYKGELAAFISWQREQCEKSGVVIRLNTEVTPDFIRDRAADAVIAATGAKPVIPDIPGITFPQVTTAVKALLCGVSGARVVVAGGGSVGVETACHLGMQGRDVCVAEMRDGFSLDEDERIREQNYKLMDELHIEQLPRTKVAEITSTGIILETEGRRYYKPADTVVLALGYRSDHTLSDRLRAVCPDVFTVGDADRASNVIDAVRSGYLIGSTV
jgi:pyruvate/2-oxoglutarate dehydrogenase complex dihydrolipoamide dehydrogenase (E3) component